MAGKLSIDIAVLLKGVEQINKLADSLTRLKNTSGGSNTTVKTPSLKQPIDEAERYNKSILNAARALATFQSASGNLAAAQRTLETAINKVGRESQITLGAQTQLARVQTQLRNEAERNERTLSANALLRARNRQSLGDEAGAVNILNRAISQLTPGTAAAARAQKLLNDISTGYANSPLIGAIQQVNRSLGFLSPVLGRTGGVLQSIVGVAGQAAQQFSNTGKASEVASKGASQFANFLNSARQAAQNFGNDQGGSASLTDFLLNLSKGVANAGERVRAALASIRDSIKNAFTQIRQGQNPLAGLFSGGTGTAGADTAKLASSLGEVEVAAQGTGEAVAGIGTAASGTAIAVAGVVVALVAIAATATAIFAVADGIKRIGEDGIAANRQLEGLRIGIASVINGVGTISKDGIELKGADAFNASLALANDQVAKIKEEAAGLGLPVQETAEAFQTTIGPLTQFGLGLDDARKTTLNIVVAMQSLGIPLREAGQEARAILQGQTDRTARLNQILRITKDELKAAKERGQVQELLNERLAGFAAGGAAFAQSFDGSIARAQARIKTFEGSVTEGLFNTIRDRLNNALEDIAKNGGIAATFSGLGDTLTNIFNRVGEAVGPIFDGILGAIKTVSDFLGQNQKTVDSIIESVAIIIEQIAGIVVDIFKVVGASGDWNENASIVATILKVVAVVLATIREQVFAFNSAVVAIGAAILRFFLEPLRLGAIALAAILSLIPGLGSVARGVSDTINGAAKSLDAAVAKNGRNVVDTVRSFGTAGADAIKRIDEASAKFAAKRKADAAKSKTDTKGITFTGKPPAEDEKDKKKASANTEASLKQLREAQLALLKAFADREIALAKAEAETQNRILDQQLEDRQISLESFYAEKAKLVEEDRQRELKAVNDAIAAERAKLAEISVAEQRQIATTTGKKAKDRKTGDIEAIQGGAQAERLKTLAKIVDLETKLNEAELKGDATAAQNTRNRIKALRDLQSQVAGISVDLARATGDDLTAALTEIDAKFNDTLKVFIANFGEQSAEVQKLLSLIGLQKQGAKAQFSVSFDVANASRDFAESEIQKQVTAGLLSEAQARQQLLDIQRAYATETLPLIRRQVAELENLAKAEIAASPTGQGSAQTRAKILDLQKREQDILRATVDPFFAEVKRGLTQDLRGSFEQFLLFSKGGLEDLKGLALGFIDGIKRAIAKVLSEQIEKKFIDPFVNKLFGTLGLGGGADPTELANITATTANTAAITGLTAAISTQGVTGQFSIGGGDGLAIPDIGGGAAKQGEAAGKVVTGPNGALNSFFDKVKSGFEKFANGLKSIATGIGNGIKSVLGAIIGGISSVLGSIGLGGGKFAGASASGSAGFAEGGYTGDGPKYQPAGVVHAGEYVIPAQRVSQFGAGFFEAIRQGRFSPASVGGYLSGLSSISVRARSGAFAEGGLAAVAPTPAATGGAQSLRIINVNDPAQAAEFLNSAAGEQVILNRITKSPAKWRAALKL